LTVVPRAARPPRAHRSSRHRSRASVVTRVLGALAAGWILAFVTVALVRSVHPFELEWIEGAMLTGVRRVLAGLPLYAAPTLDYVPLNYTPLFFWVGAGMTQLLGADFLALRIVSLLSALGVLALLVAFVRRETGSGAGGLVAAGIFCATYRLSGAWLDIARADSLYLVLLLGGAFVLRVSGDRLAGAALAGGLWALAFLAKQSAPVVVAPLAILLLLRRERPALVAPLVAASLSAVAFLALDATSEGWFRFYVLDVAAAHRPELGLALAFPGRFLLPLAPALIAFAVVARGARARLAEGALAFHACWFGGLLLSSWHLASYRGGYDNVALTACLGAALLGGIACGAIARDPVPASRAATAVAILLALQLVIVAWDPSRQLPGQKDRRAGDDLVIALRKVPTAVLMPSHPDWLRRAGKPERAHIMPLMDVVKGNSGEVGRALWQSMRDSLRARAWPVLVLDTRDWLIDEARGAGYRLAGSALREGDVLWPVTGMRTRPEWVFEAPPDSTPVDSAR
jgi:dolichyl-phosphate-mannose-protein mannosyltransferase